MKNHLWSYRHREGYTQQEVAQLIDCSSANQISRYERGTLPNLETAIGFEIVYRAPISKLFRDLYEKKRETIETRKAALVGKRQMSNKKLDLPPVLPLPSAPAPRILAIDPGCRYLGVAVLEGNALVYWGVKELGHEPLPRRLLIIGKQVVLTLIEKFEPKMLVVEKPNLTSSKMAASNLKIFCKRLRYVSKRSGMTFYAYTSKQAKELFVGGGKITKREMTLALASWYPELRSRVPRRRRPGDPEDRRQKMFDAVAFGLTCLYQTQNQFKGPLLERLPGEPSVFHHRIPKAECT